MQWKNDAVTYKDWGEPHRLKYEGLSEFVVRIDPNVDGGTVVVDLMRAVDNETESRESYFRCTKKCK